MATVLDTDEWVEKDRPHLWRDALSTMYAPLDFRPLTNDVRARVVVDRIGAVILTEAMMSSCELRRTGHNIAVGIPRTVQLVVPLEGRVTLVQDGRTVTFGAGEMALCEPHTPCILRFEETMRSLALTVPQRVLPVTASRLRTVTARVAGSESAAATTLLACLTALIGVRPLVSVDEQVHLSDSLCALLGALTVELDRSDRYPASTARDLVASIRNYIESGLSDPELTPAQIAAAHHISVRYLHRLFQRQEFTVAEMIRMRRLAGCRRDLVDPALSHLGIAQIGQRWGINDPAKFSRMFRGVYGTSPREWREEREGPS